MSPFFKRTTSLLLLLALPTVTARTASAGCVQNGNNWTWQDNEGWSSTYNAGDGSWTVYDPNWGYYDEEATGIGEYEHVFIDATGGGEFGAGFDGHTDTAWGYMSQGNFSHNCPPV
jgi:hypothetical protein